MDQGDRRQRPARRDRRRRRPAVVPRRRVHPGVRGIGAHQLRCPPPPRRRRRPRSGADAPRRRRRQAAPPRRAVLGVRVQGAGQHGSQPPRPHRVRPHLLGPVRPRDGDDVRPHRPAVRHQVRVHRVRRRTDHDRRGVPGRRGRSRQRHRAQHRRQPLRRTRPAGPLPADPPVRARGVRRRLDRSTPASSNSSARASTS